MTIELTGRIPSKKNSRRHVLAGGRRLVLPSAAYERWHAVNCLQLRDQKPRATLEGALALTMHLYLKGKIEQDLDNAVASVLNLFQDADIIADDKQVVELHLYKHGGAPDFAATIELDCIT